jgi:hypothetical protein
MPQQQNEPFPGYLCGIGDTSFEARVAKNRPDAVDVQTFRANHGIDVDALDRASRAGRKSGAGDCVMAAVVS